MLSAGIFLPLPFKTQHSLLQTFTIAKKTVAEIQQTFGWEIFRKRKLVNLKWRYMLTFLLVVFLHNRSFLLYTYYSIKGYF
jgi:hypothetical protein